MARYIDADALYMDIHNVISHSDLEYEKMMEIFKKFADLPGAEGEWIALTPVEAAKKLSIISPAPALEFMWFCDYIKKAGLAICKKR